LEAEGVIFGPDDRIDLDCYGWVGLSELEIQQLLQEAEGRDERA
jgi:hypothetical protein